MEIAIPDEVAIEKTEEVGESVPIATRAFGDRWLQERRSCVLMVPSAVVGGRERNVLINPAHTDFPKIVYSDPQDVVWGVRSFR